MRVRKGLALSGRVGSVVGLSRANPLHACGFAGRMPENAALLLARRVGAPYDGGCGFALCGFLTGVLLLGRRGCRALHAEKEPPFFRDGSFSALCAVFAYRRSLTLAALPTRSRR